jgi:hypothetical protein
MVELLLVLGGLAGVALVASVPVSGRGKKQSGRGLDATHPARPLPCNQDGQPVLSAAHPANFRRPANFTPAGAG